MLAKTSGKSDDSDVEMGHLAGSVSVEEEMFVSRERPRADRSRCLIGLLSQVSRFEPFKLLCSSSSPPNTSTPAVTVPWIHISQFCLLSFLEV